MISESSPLTVIVTRRLPEQVERRLARMYRTRFNTHDIQMGPEELRDALRTGDVVLCTLTDRLTRDVVAVEGRRARLLANFGVGFDHIDLAAARETGLVVTNTPGALTEDTADLTMLLLLSAARRASEGEAELRRGEWTGWRPTHLLGRSVNGATLGIVGLGRIGLAVARRAHSGFGMHVQYWARRPQADAGLPSFVRPVPTLEQLFESSDFISLHCPATPETHHLVNPRTLALMKRSAYLINTARGPVVDSAALAAALVAGTIAGAGLDVYEGEPQLHPGLLTAPNVTLLPHLGSATIGSRTAMGMTAVDNIDSFDRGSALPNRIA